MARPSAPAKGKTTHFGVTLPLKIAAAPADPVHVDPLREPPADAEPRVVARRIVHGATTAPSVTTRRSGDA
jgi:hypothetical protein